MLDALLPDWAGEVGAALTAVALVCAVLMQLWRERPQLSSPSRVPLDKPEAVARDEQDPGSSPGTGMQVPEYRPDTLDRLAGKKTYITFSAVMAYNAWLLVTEDALGWQITSGVFLALGLSIVLWELATRWKQERSPADP